ncbi:MAG: UDP-N-acetylmuramoylalanine--D-glutamate ligase [Candidatus Xenolissoclinum pacificiensis L6]|uniref:UDP-N-acetylmuramoylalanine--D-glutamate ligase n=1 Tax=Candidatus Xenolissoclinum pacificiensis L6 TaxID=1401685 RepID=W2V017_9RICK|nr:MAG: UDP-N-acetylmuramoylalanine--D-glutamate ligase [Candidatus Xenolissoclinum pacificiensis L6]
MTSFSIETIKSIAVLGLGVTGVSVVRYFSKRCSDITIYLADDSHDKILEVQKDYNHTISENPVDWSWEKIDFLILSPGIPCKYPDPHSVVRLALEKGCSIKSDIELYMLLYPESKYIGITGTNGKSTVVTLLTEILNTKYKASIAGNIGLAIFDAPLDQDFYVVEFSSFQLEICNQLSLFMASIINVHYDHMDRYSSFNEYLKSKLKIFDSSGTIAYVNNDQSQIISSHNNTVRYFSTRNTLESGFSIRGLDIFIDSRHIVSLSYQPIPDENIILCLSMAYDIGIEIQHIVTVIENFRILEHRMEVFREEKGVIYINDSKATNAHATACALKSLSGDIIWVAGGRMKGYDDLSIIPVHNVIKAFFIGEAKEIFSEQFSFLNHETLSSLEEVIDKVQKFVEHRKDVYILFSPACSSFDMWSNFIKRGQDFKRCVSEMLSDNE